MRRGFATFAAILPLHARRTRLWPRSPAFCWEPRASGPDPRLGPLVERRSACRGALARNGPVVRCPVLRPAGSLRHRHDHRRHRDLRRRHRDTARIPPQPGAGGLQGGSTGAERGRRRQPALRPCRHGSEHDLLQQHLHCRPDGRGRPARRPLRRDRHRRGGLRAQDRGAAAGGSRTGRGRVHLHIHRAAVPPGRAHGHHGRVRLREGAHRLHLSGRLASSSGSS